MPAGLGTLFAGLLLIVLAFVEGSSVWKALHEVLFGLFGCGSFVLGAAICYLAILYTRGEDLIGQMFKLMLGLVFASGTGTDSWRNGGYAARAAFTKIATAIAAYGSTVL